jgi:hypothetical protein
MPEFRCHHIGIPTDKEFPAEDYIPAYKIYALGYMESPYGAGAAEVSP